MNRQELLELLRQPESETLEFKMGIPSQRTLGPIISGFANTEGGVLLLGVGDKGEITGVDRPDLAQKALDLALEKTKPRPYLRSELISLEDKKILVISVHKSKDGPIAFDGTLFERVDAKVVPRVSPYAPDVHASAVAAVLEGSGARADGSESLAAGVGGIAVGRDVSVSGRQIAHEFISYEAAFERVAESTEFVLHQLELSYTLAREQAQGWYRSSLISAGIGFVLILAGVVLVLFNSVAGGVITSISGLIPNAAAALFFKQSQAANVRIDAIQTRLTEAREIQAAVEIANTIEDRASRDKLKAIIVKRALRLNAD